MNSNIKNIILFALIALLAVASYLFFTRDKGEEANLTSTLGESPSGVTLPSTDSSMNQDFLSVLLSVKSIRLDVSIFSDPVFLGLRDSSILLVPTLDEGRPNPFAPLTGVATPPRTP